MPVWATLFHTEIGHAVEVWNTSTAYGHCWLVLPIALYLAWDRREGAAGVAMRPVLWPALAGSAGAVAWFAAERLGIMEARQLMAVGFAQLLVLAVLGWRLARVYGAAILYLLFLVPFGTFLTADLQRFTASFVDAGLDVSGIPYIRDQFTIEIPEGAFHIAEACAGLRFLIASLAFGVLYACVMYRSPWRRAAFVVASCIVPVLANGVRALGVIVLGHVLGSAEAAAADHVIYGWVFFSAVILLLGLIGLPFREDDRKPPALCEGVVAGAASRAWLAAGAVMVAAAIGPVVAAAIERGDGAGTDAPVLPAFIAGPGCTARTDAAAPGVQRFTCNSLAVTASVEVFPLRANPAVLFAARRRAGAEDAAEEVMTSRITGTHPPEWRLVETARPDRMVATALWIDADPDAEGLAGRLRQARNTLLGGGVAPVLMAVRVEGAAQDGQGQQKSRAVMRAFLEAQGDLTARVVRPAQAGER